MEQRVIAGKYRLIRTLGQGAMGSVWLAEHLSLHTPVAIKLIHIEAARDTGARARFDREAQLAARIRSAHVVKVLDHGTTEDGLPYIAMECLAGESLRDRLRARKRLSPAETAKIVSHVCRALARAHEAGLVHRDLKPENIFVAREDDDEIVKILDFGVAKATDTLAAAGMDPTRTGALLGTPYYMSPEQAQGLKSVDYRSDLWSVGIVAFECLTGARPFTAPALGPLIARIVGTPPPALAEVAPDAQIPPDLEAWMRKALARDPAARFASAKELSEAFMVAAGTVDTMNRGRSGSFPEAAPPGAVSSPAAAASAPGLEAAPTVVLPEAGETAPAVIVRPSRPGPLAPAIASGPGVSPAPAGAIASSTLPATASAAPRGMIGAVLFLGVAVLVLGGVLAAIFLR